MRNGLARLKETYPSDHISISVSLGKAILNDNQSSLSQLISTYFATDETSKLLNGAIAAFVTEDEDVEFYSPATLAVMAGAPNALRRILKITKNPNARSDPNTSIDSPPILIRAVVGGKQDIADILIKEGANISEQWVNVDENNEKSPPISPLECAIAGGYSKMANMLLDCGAIPSLESVKYVARDFEGVDPLLVRMINMHPELLRVREDMFGHSLNILHAVVLTTDNVEVVKWLVEKGADINAETPDGFTPLDCALDQDKTEIAAYLQMAGGLTGKRNGSVDSGDATKREITGNVERLELLEDKFGINISSLYATCETRTWDTPITYSIAVNFDVTSPTGASLEKNFSIRASAYNAAGQLLGTESTYIDKDEFFGFASMSMSLYVDQPPGKIRLFPAA